jgi:TolB-like protein
VYILGFARRRLKPPLGTAAEAARAVTSLQRHRRAASSLAGAMLLLAAPLPAQCPDGTPPPCGRAAAPRASNPRSVGVLYFDNLSRDSSDVLLADGLTDELITRLGQVARLEVRSRFESQRLRGQRSGDPRAMGRMLHAAFLVTGSLQQVGTRVRVNVALVRAQDGAQVWGDVYDRAGDILSIQADIAREVAGAITGRLLPQERASLARLPTRDPVAYDLYLRGVGAANTFSEAGVRAGLDYFDRAIARDSGFAAAYLQRSLAWGVLADGYIEGRVGYARAREGAERALRLDSSLAEAQAMIAATTLSLDADVARARVEARRALRLDPKSWISHLVLSWAAFLSGNGADSGLVEARLGWEADTLSAVSAWNYVMTLAVLRRTDAIAAVLPRMENVLAPEDLRVFDGVVRLERGDTAAAERLSWSYYGGVVAAEYVRAQLVRGRRDLARAAVDSMVALSRGGYYNAFSVARAFAALGDAGNAFVWLDRAWDQRTNFVVFTRDFAEFASLHGDPRWAAFFRRMGVTP